VSRPALLLVVLSTAACATSCGTDSKESEPLATGTTAPITFLRGVDIVAVDLDGRNERTLAKLKLPRGHTLQGLSWSPDGRQLLYALETPVIECCSYVDVYVMNADGSGHRKIRRTNVYTRTPTWSPSGDRILIDDNDDGGHTMWVVRPDGSGAVKVFGEVFGSGFPAWSPDGTQIAYYDELGDWIYVMNADGSAPKRVTRAHLEGTALVWAPAKQIVFYLGRDIWVVNPDGSGGRMAIKGQGEEGGFEISPDGRTIAFAYLAGPGNFDLSSGRISGGAVRKLTDNEKDDCCPSWSPDGRSLAFTRAGDIYLINADGSGERNLTESTADESLLGWLPKG
jgi:TolB protein